MIPLEKSGEKSGSKNGKLVKQEHGGALRHGSKPGNTPGTGRPRNKIKDSVLAIFDQHGVKVLTEVMTEGEKDSDRIRAAEVAARIGGLTAPELYDPELVDVLARATSATLTEHGIDDEVLGKKLSEAWMVALGKHVRRS